MDSDSDSDHNEHKAEKPVLCHEDGAEKQGQP